MNEYTPLHFVWSQFQCNIIPSLKFKLCLRWCCEIWIKLNSTFHVLLIWRHLIKKDLNNAYPANPAKTLTKTGLNQKGNCHNWLNEWLK